MGTEFLVLFLWRNPLRSSTVNTYSLEQARQDLIEILQYVRPIMQPIPELSPTSVTQMGSNTVEIRDCETRELLHLYADPFDVLQMTGVEYRPKEYRISLRSESAVTEFHCLVKVTNKSGNVIYDGPYYMKMPDGIVKEIMTTKVGQQCRTTFRDVTFECPHLKLTASDHPVLGPIFQALQTPLMDAVKRVAFQYNEVQGLDVPIKHHMCQNLGKIVRMSNIG